MHYWICRGLQQTGPTLPRQRHRFLGSMPGQTPDSKIQTAYLKNAPYVLCSLEIHFETLIPVGQAEPVSGTFLQTLRHWALSPEALGHLCINSSSE